MSLSIGQQFAGYTVQRRLGSGGMGEVYLVQHPRLPRLDALRILPASLTADDEYRQRFHREADLAATLWHPHIIGVHDRGEHDGQLWISTDYVDGTDAAQMLRTHPDGLAVTDVLDIVDGVAVALDFAHHGGLLHRDVKPANILITAPPAGRRRILLADFGIARYADDVSGLTATNIAVGTVSYAAPEQLVGKPLSGAADQYALAATTYHLLVGAPPFVNTNPAVVIGQHLAEAPPPVAARRPELAVLDPVLARALAKQPADRFPSCLEFATALRAAVEGVASTAIPDEPTVQADPAYRHTVIAASWPSPAPTTVATGPILEFPPATMAQPKRSRAAVVVPVVLTALLVAAGVFGHIGHGRADGDAPPRWAPYVEAASETATALTTLRVATVDTDVQRVLDSATGRFYDDFAEQAEDFKTAVREEQSSSTGSVTGAGLEKIDGDHATVVVAVTLVRSRVDAPQEDPQGWRLRLRVKRVGDAYKVDNVEFVK